MNYTLNQLKIFLKITQARSITKAAEELNLTQPAVSIQLKNFQDQFDIPLTEVVGRKIHITDFGKEIAQAAESILEQVAAINSKAHSFKGHLTGRLKISIVTTGIYVMPYFLSPFMREHANLDLIMDVTNRVHVIESLEQNTIDFALLSFLPESPVVEKLDLLENKFFLVGNGAENFRKSPYPKSILKELPLIFREKGSGTRLAMENYIKRNHLEITPKMELTSNEAVKEAVVSGLGYSIMPLTGIKNELENGNLKVISVAGFPIKSTWRLVWLKGKRHSPVAAAFLAFVRKEKNAIIAKHFSYDTA
jgi:DNA-binding transcriptional LysR family regulator